MARTTTALLTTVMATAVLPPCTQARSQTLQIRPAEYPRLPASADRPQALTPKGWAIEKLVIGDLNGDSLPDAVLLLHQRDPRNLIRPKGWSEAVDTNPRVLAVALKARDGRYRAVLQNHTLIGRRTDPVLSDPMEEGGIEVRHDVLKVRVGYFSSFGGGWVTYNSTFSFAWRDGGLRLVGYDRYALDRSDASSRAVSVDYLTGKVKLTTQSDGDDAVARTRWKSLPSRPLLLLDRVGDGLDFRSPGVPDL